MVVREPNIDKVLTALRGVVGAAHVLTDPAELMERGDPYAATGSVTRTTAVVLPGSVEEVQSVVRIANDYGVSLWVTSQGRNNGYGGGAPRLPGTVVVSLRRMNRILEINSELAYAVVEPGVSFFDLADALREGKFQLTPSVPDLGWGSVIGNTLEHGIGYTSYGDHASAQCGMEVVLPDGDLLRTGMGAMTSSKTWHTHRRGFGPNIDGLFMQSNLGIVTKMGVWLMPTPERYVACEVHVRNDRDLEPLVDSFRSLLLDGTIQNVPVLSNAVMSAGYVSKRSDWWAESGPMSEATIVHIARSLGIGRWSGRFALHGPDRVVEEKLLRARRAFAAIPEAWLEARSYAGDAPPTNIDEVDHVQGGIPSLNDLEVVKWRGGDNGGHVCFSPVGPLTGRAVREQLDAFTPIIHRYGFDLMSGIMLFPRSFTQVFEMYYDRTNVRQVEDAFAATRELIRTGAALGFPEYRAHIDTMDDVAAEFDFNGHVTRRFIESIKDAVDPNGILAPGKQGIWPRTPVRQDGVRHQHC